MPPSVTANNSVTLSWAQPEGTLPSENYVISLQRGTNQPLCSDETDSRQMTTNNQSIIFPNLYGISSYTVTVLATAFGVSMMTSRQFMTSASRKFMIKPICWHAAGSIHTLDIYTSLICFILWPEGLYKYRATNY